jgi:hypothetical protein
LKGGIISLSRNQLRDLQERLPLFDLYFVLPKARELGISLETYVGYHEMDLCRTSTAFLLGT